jgi:hypothetical protein
MITIALIIEHARTKKPEPTLLYVGTLFVDIAILEAFFK